MEQWTILIHVRQKTPIGHSAHMITADSQKTYCLFEIQYIQETIHMIAIYFIILVIWYACGNIPSSLSYKPRLTRQLNCWPLGCRWSIACRRCSNYIFILHLTHGSNRLRKDNWKPRRETFKFWDLVSEFTKSFLWVVRACGLQERDCMRLSAKWADDHSETILTRVSNHMPNKVWDETVEVWNRQAISSHTFWLLNRLGFKSILVSKRGPWGK